MKNKQKSIVLLVVMVFALALPRMKNVDADSLTIIETYSTSEYDKFGFASSENWNRYSGNPILTAGRGDWDEGFLVKPSVIYRNDKYWLYYYGQAYPGNPPRSIGLATSTDGYDFIKEASNPILSPDPGQWDKRDVFEPAILFHKGEYWLYYAGAQVVGGTMRVGLAKSTDGVNFIRITNGINGTSKVLEEGEANEWDENGVHPCSVIYRKREFKLYYWSYWSTPTHVAIGLATSTNGVNFTRITDGLDGTSKVLREEGESWEDAGPFRGSVFYYKGKYRMYYSGTTATPVLRKDIGYAESDDGKNWTRAPSNPVMLIGTAAWENDYLVACSFIWKNGNAKNKGLVYYQGAYISYPLPTNRIGLFEQFRKASIDDVN